MREQFVVWRFKVVTLLKVLELWRIHRLDGSESILQGSKFDHAKFFFMIMLMSLKRENVTKGI
jgi:hypothetical protein